MQGRDLTNEQIAKFLRKLLLTHGNVSKACKSVAISRKAIYEHKKNDPQFSELWEDVIENCIETAETELYRRSVKGINKPVFYKGILVQTVKEFSDRLLEFYLKAKRPEVYRDRVDINANVSGNLDMNIQAAIKEVYGSAKESDGDGKTDLENE